MRRVSLFQLTVPLQRITNPAPEQHEAPPDPLSPSQQLALLQLRGSELSSAVVARLKHSTVRSGPSDHEALLSMQLILMHRNGKYKLTPRGHFRANAIARELAPTLGIRVEFIGRRSTFRPGLFSQNGNW